MKKDVLITIKGSQTNDIGELETIELITNGTFFTRASNYYLIYKESSLTGMEETTTSLKAEPSKVTLNRMGKNQLKQVFEVGIHNNCVYITPYGRIVLGVRSSKVQVDLTDEGGSINLEYELEVGKDKVSDNKLSITVKEVRS